MHNKSDLINIIYCQLCSKVYKSFNLLKVIFFTNIKKKKGKKSVACVVLLSFILSGVSKRMSEFSLFLFFGEESIEVNSVIKDKMFFIEKLLMQVIQIVM